MRTLKILFSALLLSFSALAETKPEAPEIPAAPFASDENLQYISGHEKPTALMQPLTYRGMLVREETKSRDLYYIELHDPPEADAERIDVDAKFCERAAGRMFGSVDEAPWVKGESFEYENRYGKVCELKISNKLKIASLKEYRITVAVIHGKAHVLVAKFHRVASDDDVEELRMFVKSLYSAHGADETTPSKSSRRPASESVKK